MERHSIVRPDAGESGDERVNILLVDDRPDKLMALEIVLASLGQNLVLAHSGTEALRHLLQQEFALIVLDVIMPASRRPLSFAREATPS
jgi:CheY-like chemotaxis protein